MRPLDNVLVRTGASTRDVLALIDANHAGIAIVVDRDGRLVGTVTDGDVRRAILRGLSLDEPVTAVMCDRPIAASEDANDSALVDLLNLHRISQLPVVDGSGRPTGLFHVSDALVPTRMFAGAVVMAGGEGRRLRPLTDTIPKPLAEIGGRPMIERIIESIATIGVQQIYVAVNYKANLIIDRLGDGSALGVQIEYLHESERLGTAGALSLLPTRPAGPILVMNGDVLTKVPLDELFRYHYRHRCSVTMCAVEYKVRVPFGVIETAGALVTGLAEKPSFRFLCNAGIYAMDPDVLHLAQEPHPLDMTDLVERVVANGQPVGAFPITEQWLDVGNPESLALAEELFGER